VFNKINNLNLNVQEGIVKQYILRVLKLNSEDEHIEVLTQRLNEQFYVIQADSKNEAIARYKRLKKQ
jgi:hypothetical protein